MREKLPVQYIPLVGILLNASCIPLVCDDNLPLPKEVVLSLFMSAINRPSIVYHDLATSAVGYYSSIDSTWSSNVVAESVETISDISFGLDHDDTPILLYRDRQLHLVLVARQGNLWESSTLDQFESGPGYQLVIDSAGRSHIFHCSTDQHRIYHVVQQGSTWDYETIYQNENDPHCGLISAGSSGGEMMYFAAAAASGATLLIGKKQLAGWRIDSADISRKPVLEIASAMDGGDVVHVVFIQENSAGAMQYATSGDPVITTETVTQEAVFISSVSLDIGESGTPCTTFLNVSTQTVFCTCREQGVWVYETVVTQDGIYRKPVFRFDSVGEKKNVAYYNHLTGGINYAIRSPGSNQWQKQNVGTLE